MSTFSKPDYDSKNYEKLRPTYPLSLFKALKQSFPLESAVDVGCGPGTASTQLARYYRVTAIDPSQRMIDVAMAHKHPGLEFKKGSGSDLASLFEPSSVGLVMAAQAAHWFDLPQFWAQAHKVLEPNGGVALVGYADPHIVEYPEVQPVLLDFTYGSTKLGPFWDNGRDILRSLYTDIKAKVPPEFEVIKFDPLQGDAPDYSKHPLGIERTTDLAGVCHYLGTYSSYHNWKAANPGKPDVVEGFAKDMQALGIKLERKLTVRWNTTLLLARKIARR